MIKPTSITLNKTDGYLQIEWSDGQACQYPLSHLREACPCVECRGGHQNMGLAHAPSNLLTLLPARSYKIQTIESIGTYAVQPTWDDGHHTGIYTWEYLRKLCPEETASND